MRVLAATVLWLVATLSFTVTIGTTWAATHVQDEDGFVALASGLAADADVQRAVAALAGEATADQPRVPVILHDRVADVVERMVLRLTAAPGWDRAWADTTRRTHQRLFAQRVPRDVRVDVAPVAAVAIDEAAAMLPVELPRPDSLPVVVSHDDPAPFVEAVSRADSAAMASGAVAVVSALLALLAARRRSRMFVQLGFGALIAAGTWWLIGRLVVPRLVERSTEATAQGRSLHRVVSDRVVSSMDDTLLWVAVAGVLVVLAGSLSRARSSGRGDRTSATRA